MEGQAAGGVEQSVAQRLGLAGGQFGFERSVWVQAVRSWAISAISSETAVCSKPWNGRVGQAGLLGDADAVLGAGAGEVQALKLDRVAVEADRAVGALADAVADGVGKVVAALGTVWVKIGTPQVATQPGSSEPSPAVAFMQSQL